MPLKICHFIAPLNIYICTEMILKKKKKKKVCIETNTYVVHVLCFDQ